MNTTIEDRLRSYAATLDAATEAKSAGRDGTVIETLPAPTSLRPHRDRRLLAAAAAIALLVIVGAALAVSRDHDRSGVVATKPSVTTEPTIHFTPLPSVPPTVPPTTGHPASAADDLAPFFTGATGIDQKLKAAATQINREFSPNGHAAFDQADVDAVAAADPTRLAKTIPGGMSPELETAVLTVWSELDSRFKAMCVGLGDYQSGQNPDLSGCFTNGTEAASRFDADLATARSLAAANPPIAHVPPDSHAAGEVAVQVNAIEEANGGCGSTGGFIVSALRPVVWKTTATDLGTFQGTIGDTPFNASYSPATGWVARLNVC